MRNSSDTPISDALIDVHTHIGADLLFYLKGHYPYCLDWPTLVDQGLRSGIGRFGVFPMVTHLGLNVAELREGRITAEGAMESVPYAFENRRMMTELHRLFPDLKERALPFWMLDPSRNATGQYDALRVLHEEFPCAGLKVQATVTRSFIHDFWGESSCLLDLAEEKNWPLIIHTSVHPDDPWSAMADILDVVRSRPKVRFNLAHSCRYDLPTLDEVAALPNVWFDCSAHIIHCRLALEDSPSIAARERRFVSDYRNPAGVLTDLAEAYPEKLMWGSDAPFHSYSEGAVSLFSSYESESEALHALPAKAIQRIARTNILSFLGQS